MTALASPSRRRINRVLELDRRLAELTHELDTLPDRRAPLNPEAAQRGWRVIDDLRRTLRLPPTPESDRGREPFKLVVQVLEIGQHFNPRKALGIKATPLGPKKSYPRASRRR